MYTFTQLFIGSERERRLCALAQRDLASMAETMQAQADIIRNPALNDALELFSNSLVIRRYPELQQPQDRAMFFALLFDDMLPDTLVDLATIQKKDINIRDPFGLIEQTSVTPGTPDDLQLAVVLKTIALNIYEELNDEIDAAIISPERERQIGLLYRQQLSDISEKWNKGEEVGNNLAADIAIAQYRECKKTVDKGLSLASLNPPGTESPSAMSNATIDRETYLALLLAVKRGVLTQPIIAGAGAPPAGIEGIYNLIASIKTDPVTANNIDRVEQLFAAVTPEELGPNETLARFGVSIGQEIIREYYDLRKGATAQPPYAPGTQPVPQAGIESADAWELNPRLAWNFLNGRMVETPANIRFLTALRWYADNNWQLPADIQTVDGLMPDDVRETLRLIIQQLKEAEQVMLKTYAKRNEMRSELDIVQRIEGVPKAAWEYIVSDFSEHPFTSAIMGVAAFAVVKKALKFATGERSPFSITLMAGAIGGLALGIYQKKQNGEAWWEGAIENMNEWFGNERLKNPEEQTLPNYWMKQLELTDARERVCLSVLQDQPIGATLDWYDAMRSWQASGADASRQPLLPPNVPSATRRFNIRFENTSTREIGMLYFKTLEKFFADRGKNAEESGLFTTLPSTITGAAEKGYYLMRTKYVERVFFKTILESGFVAAGRTFTPAEIKQLMDGKLVTTKMAPAQAEILYIIREGYLREQKQVNSANWQMWNMFMQETNPEILRRMGGDANAPATWLENAWAEAEKAAANAFQATVATLDTLGVQIANGVDFASDKVQDFITNIPDFIQKFPGAVITFTGTTFAWIDKQGKKLGEWSYDTYRDMQKQIYALHGIPEANFEQFEGNESYVQSKGLEVTVLRTSEVSMTMPGYPNLQVPASAFATADAAQLEAWIDEWLETATATKQNTLRNAPYGLNITFDPASNVIKFDTQTTVLRAQSPAFQFLRTSNDEILAKFDEWLINAVPGDIDPLN